MEISKQYDVTVIVPVTRMAGKLGNLKSWLENTPVKWQIIIIHDCQDEETSPELTRMILNLSNPNIYLQEGKYGDPGSARNAGLDFALGVWTLFWDSDDVGYPKAVQNWINGSPSNSADLVVFRFEKCNLQLDESAIASRNWDYKLKGRISAWAIEPGIWRCLIKTNVIQSLRFPEISMGEDQVLLASVLSKCESIGFSEQIVYRYYLGNPSQLTNSRFKLSDLETARKLILNLKKSKHTFTKRFANILWWKMTITIYKRSQGKSKIALTFLTLGNLFKQPISSIVSLHAIVYWKWI